MFMFIWYYECQHSTSAWGLFPARFFHRSHDLSPHQSIRHLEVHHSFTTFASAKKNRSQLIFCLWWVRDWRLSSKSVASDPDCGSLTIPMPIVSLTMFYCSGSAAIFSFFNGCPSRLGSKSILLAKEFVWICRIEYISLFLSLSLYFYFFLFLSNSLCLMDTRLHV